MKPLSEMTQQEAFDAACAGLAEQGFQQSVNEADLFRGCQYRGSGGKKCALGHLIPDEAYSPRMEATQTRGVLCDLGVPPDGPMSLFLHSLQSAHDGADGPSSMRGNLRGVASAYRLVAPDSIRLTEQEQP